METAPRQLVIDYDKIETEIRQIHDQLAIVIRMYEDSLSTAQGLDQKLASFGKWLKQQEKKYEKSLAQTDP